MRIASSLKQRKGQKTSKEKRKMTAIRYWKMQENKQKKNVNVLQK
jgi:hypothetical protein